MGLFQKAVTVHEVNDGEDNLFDLEEVSGDVSFIDALLQDLEQVLQFIVAHLV